MGFNSGFKGLIPNHERIPPTDRSNIWTRNGNKSTWKMRECLFSCKNIQKLSVTLLHYIHFTVCWRKWRNAVCSQSTFGALTVTDNEIWLWQIAALVCKRLWVRDTVFWDMDCCNLLEIYSLGQIYWLKLDSIPKTKFARGDYVFIHSLVFSP